jgi:hypothetical protein
MGASQSVEVVDTPIVENEETVSSPTKEQYEEVEEQEMDWFWPFL